VLGALTCTDFLGLSGISGNTPKGFVVALTRAGKSRRGRGGGNHPSPAGNHGYGWGRQAGAAWALPVGCAHGSEERERDCAVRGGLLVRLVTARITGAPGTGSSASFDARAGTFSATPAAAAVDAVDYAPFARQH
jgi:hypothetical protein